MCIRDSYYESGTYDSPLTWPLLLHELFHAVYDKEKLSRLKLSSSATWIPEVIIDLYAAIFFGPVYAVSLAKYHERFPGGGGVSHPHQGPRLYALLQFLRELVDQGSTLPKTVQNIISSSFDSTTKIWSQYSKEKTDLQDKISKVYPEIKESCVKLLESRKLLSFQDFTKDPINASESGFEATKVCYQLGVPTEADPRVLFNTLLLSEIDPHPLYVTESLKRWYLSALWHRSESAVIGTLFSG